MTSSAEPAQTQSRLRDLVARGFRFLHPRNEDGEIVAVIGVRAHNSVVDLIRLHAEDDANATRMRGDERDIFAPTKVVWQRSGRAYDVLDALLALPDDHTPGVMVHADDASAHDVTTKGCWVPVRPGRAKWLAAAG